jgi:peptide deformylase
MISTVEEEAFDLAKPLVPASDPILREVMPKFDFKEPIIDPTGLAHILAQSCLKYNGIGLSAPQIGLRYRACIIKASPMICMFNPNIVGESESKTDGEEGCLTFPNLIIKVKRSDVIRVRYAMPNGEIKTDRFEGLTSRIVQHEISHLDGKLFVDGLSRLKLEQICKKTNKLYGTKYTYGMLLGKTP